MSIKYNDKSTQNSSSTANDKCTSCCFIKCINFVQPTAKASNANKQVNHEWLTFSTGNPICLVQVVMMLSTGLPLASYSDFHRSSVNVLLYWCLVRYWFMPLRKSCHTQSVNHPTLLTGIMWSTAVTKHRPPSRQRNIQAVEGKRLSELFCIE